MISENYKKKYFAKVFTELLNQWKRENNKSQSDFANIIGAHPNSISRYKKAEDFPNESTLIAIAKELGVNVDIFYPSTDVEKFLYDTDFFDKTSKAWASRFLNIFEKYKINYDFYQFLIYSTNRFKFFSFECGPWYEQRWLEPSTGEYVELDNPALQAYVFTSISKQGYCDITISTNENTKKVRILVADPVSLNGYILGLTENDLYTIKDMQVKTSEYLELLTVKNLIDSHMLKTNTKE